MTKLSRYQLEILNKAATSSHGIASDTVRINTWSILLDKGLIQVTFSHSWREGNRYRLKSIALAKITDAGRAVLNANN